MRALRERRFLLIDGGAAPLNLVWVDHVIDVMLAAAERPQAVGEVFNVMDEVDRRPPSVREVATAIAEACGLRPPARSVPFAVALAASRVVFDAFRVARAKAPPPLTPFSVVILTRDVVYDASKAARLLGFTPRQGALEGIRREAEAHAGRQAAGAAGAAG